MSAQAKAASCPMARDHKPFEHPGTYRFFSRARRECPVFFNEEIGYWVVTRHEDILEILRDPATFSADIALQPVNPYPDGLVRFLNDSGFGPEKVHPDCDPPKHARIRGIAARYLNIRTYLTLEEDMREMVRGYIADMKGKGVVDLVDSLTYEFPARVIFLLFGESGLDPRQLKAWGTNRLALVWGRLSEAERIAAGEELLAFWNFAGGIVEDRLENPGDDYPSYLLEQRNGDDSVLSLREIQSMLFALLFAGHETTTNAAGNIVIELMRNREQWDKLVADPSLIPQAVEEGLRFASSVVAWRRRTTRPVEIRGTQIPENAPLLICLASANHDEAVFEDPETFDAERKNARSHIAFGYGEHFCIGGPLARIELKIVLEELTAAFPEMRLVDGQELEWNESLSFRGPHQLLVELGN